MDSFRGFEDEAAMRPVHDEESAIERPPEIGVDERRMHVRAYNYWVSLLDGRPFPSIQDVDPHTIDDFGSNSVLLDFSKDSTDPEIAFLGRALRTECELDNSIQTISQVPSRSLLSRLTDHYLQIIANRAPIGFEAEFVGQRGQNTLYRGILMPLSSNGDTIDFIYGVINWKEMADSSTVHALVGEVDRAAAAVPPAECPIWADGPHAEFAETGDEDTRPTPGLFPDDDEALEMPKFAADAGLADRLGAARECAAQALAVDQRSRGALYCALSFAYDFALAAEDEPEAYAELLEDAGLTMQARAPMTPMVKLVFGADYDKTRLTEFAATLSWARREGVAAGMLADTLGGFAGGIKGVVQAERRARRPEARPDRAEEIRERLRHMPAFANVEIELPDTDDEFILLVARREIDGRLAIVAPVADRKLTDQAIRKSAA
jgi:hypothetical protein